METVTLEKTNVTRSHPVFALLGDDEYGVVIQYFKQVRLAVNEWLMEEGHASSIDLYLVCSGKLEVVRRTVAKPLERLAWETPAEFSVATLEYGDFLGELSFVKGVPRAASIRCVAPALLLSLSPADFARMEAEHPRAAGHLMKNLLGNVGERLKKTTDNEVSALKVELQSSLVRSKANLFFSYVIGLLCVYNLAVQGLINLSMDTNRASLISAGTILVFCGVLIVMIRQSGLPIHLFGLTTRGWKPAVSEAMTWTAVIVVALIGIKWALVTYVPRYQHLPVFGFDPVHTKYLAFNFALYGLHSPVQEFIARGVLQGSLQHFFKGHHVTWRAILISNALFSATHVHLLGGLRGLVVFIPGLFWGWLYSRNENLIGVSISHLIIGWTALFFLNLETLF